MSYNIFIVLLLKLLVIAILILQIIFLLETFSGDIFVVINEFIINELLMKGEAAMKKLIKSKKASCIYMEMFN